MYTENHCMSSKQAKLILHRSGTQKTKKLAWINKSDPRLPSKAHIIRQTLQLLISNTHNEETFPSTTISSGNRKREDLGNIFKPTVPRFPRHGPHNKPRFFTCKCVAPVPTPRTTAVSKPRSQQNLEPQSTSDLHRPQRRGSAPMQAPP